MSKRKILLVAMSLCMVAILAVGGSLAYLTDTDKKTNTFTVGNVKIQIDEWMDQNADGEWEEYTDEQHLSPFDYINNKVVRNKIVETVNTGTEDAYIRTFITCPTYLYDVLGLGFNAGSGAKIEYDAAGNKIYYVTWKDIGTCDINDVKTSVFLCEVAGATDADKVVAPKESVVSLTSVWLYPNVDNSTVLNGKFEVLAASQAIQAEGLTYAKAMEELGTYANAVETLFGATVGSFVAK